MRVTFHPGARRELHAAMDRYNAGEPGLGMEFVQAVADCIGRMKFQPESYPIVVEDYRRARIRRFPYGLIYRIREDSLEIVSVMHERRKPVDYWDRPK